MAILLDFEFNLYTYMCNSEMSVTYDVDFRTTVLASLSKRGDNGHQLLSANSMLQMAGRAGRRGIDEQGHTVVVQTPFEGAEDCCRLLFAGSDPLVSQFTATYGMALNLLAVRASFQMSPVCRCIQLHPTVPVRLSQDISQNLMEHCRLLGFRAFTMSPEQYFCREQK